MKKNHIKLNTLSRFEFFQKKREFKNMFSFLSLSHDLIKACVKGREYSQSYFASSCRKSSVIDSLLNHFGYLNQKSENLKINGLLKETSHCVFQTHTPLVRSFICSQREVYTSPLLFHNMESSAIQEQAWSKTGRRSIYVLWPY